MYKNILVPTDGSELSRMAIEHGVSLAKQLNANITFVTVRSPFHSLTGEPEMVVEMPEDYKQFVHSYLSEEYDKRLADARSVAETSEVDCTTVYIEQQHPYQGIIDTAAEHGCDLILMASHGRRGVSGVILGSETAKVLTHCEIPVLVCR